MKTSEYISSGRLEMYVLGHLSEQENIEIAQLRRTDPEFNLEITKIQSAIIKLTAAVAPTLSSEMIDAIVSTQTPSNTKVETKKRTNWAAISGWTLSFLLLLGAAFVGFEYTKFTENQNKSQQTMTAAQVESDSINELRVRNDLIINLLRLPATTKYILKSEDNSTDVTATLFYNHNELTAILDLSNLPILGQEEVYQLWIVTNTEEGVLYKSVFVSEVGTKESTTLNIINGISAESLMLSIETDSAAVEPSAIRFIPNEN